MQDDLSYPLSAQSLPVPFYVVLEGRIVYANAAGVCMVRALSVDQLLGEPFSRFFLDAPESLQLDAARARDWPATPATDPPHTTRMAPALPDAQAVPPSIVRLTITPTRFDGMPAQQVVVHGLPLPLDAQLPGKPSERVLNPEAIGAALPHEHLDHLLSTLPSMASLGERLSAALRALEAALPQMLCVVARVVSNRVRLYGTRAARAQLAGGQDAAARLTTAAQSELDAELARAAPALNDLPPVELTRLANAPAILRDILARVPGIAPPAWVCRIPAQHDGAHPSEDLFCLFYPSPSEQHRAPDDAAQHHACSGYIGALVKLLRLEGEYRQARDLRDQYRLVVNHLSEGVLTLSTDGRVLSYNRSAAEILRLSGASWKSRSRLMLGDMMLAEDGSILPRAAWPSTLAARTGRAISNVVVGMPAGNGQIVWLRESVLPMFSQDSATPHAVLVIFTDITTERSTYEQLRLLETKDPLTGLPNRAAFIERLDARLALPSTGQAALLYVGLDHFKTVNEAMGHHIGNQVLNVAAHRIRADVGQRALLARLGGDQFCVTIDAPEQAETLAQQILDALAKPFPGGEREVHLSASVGVAMFPEDGGDAATLVSRAEAAMYRAKENGRNRMARYSRALETQILRRFTLNERMRRALGRGHVRLVYQPKYALATRELVAVEALMRWSDPELGAVSPTEFIAVAEESGYILELGRWALLQACSQGQAWERDFDFTGRVAVNVSARQCDAGVIERDVDEALGVSGLRPSRLELELTESVLLADRLSTQRLLTSLAARGVRIALDDFGIGFSSLSYLRSLPIHNIKIDRSFISGVPAVADCVALTKTIIAMAQALNMTVTAEGVETPEQSAFLAAHACDEVQGFLFGRPLEVPAMESLLRSRGAVSI
ncbi:putative bifunctional diguanylate cyclase/phosphodiesterase [Ralstonia solanacearum]|uniref:putative bifunctional diguanylate cyclase/phosphodiesterase n=1 Tax=Ralstonia solanacearum TaxID=305 RepID=UPI001FFAD109|nr:EAL domain-containing protein [Ralstonia solanacearum]MDB0568894.1 EAL domain-containing protein [Ralstonia solanacearum]MDB0578628.1 EAL domain-containing protein [Ralstonia solanacearum]